MKTMTLAGRILLHPDNARLVRVLGGDGSGVAEPEVYDLHTRALGTHPDLVDHLWKKLGEALPERCALVVCERPVLVHPGTGIIFAFAMGTHAYALRLPPDALQEAQAAGAPRVWRTADRTWLDLEQVGPEWVLGGWKPQEEKWCLRAYQNAAQAPA